MSISLLSLAGFAAWALVLPAIYVGYRVALVLSGKKPANSWTRGSNPENPALITRIEHAHMNTLESLPVFAVVILVAFATDQFADTDTFAPWVLGLRIAQSLVCFIGTTHWLVFVRANLFVGQVALMGWMLWLLTCG